MSMGATCMIPLTYASDTPRLSDTGDYGNIACVGSGDRCQCYQGGTRAVDYHHRTSPGIRTQTRTFYVFIEETRPD